MRRILALLTVLVALGVTGCQTTPPTPAPPPMRYSEP